MVTVNKTADFAQSNGTIKHQIEGHCLSTDTKPIENVLNGSMLLEMDTSTVFFFDEANHQWIAWS